MRRARRATGRPDLEDDEEEEEEDDDDGYLPWGNWTSGRRGMPREETSLKSIKTVQGEEGQWTVTDADSTKSGDRSVRNGGFLVKAEGIVQDDLLVDYTVCAHVPHRRAGFGTYLSRLPQGQERPRPVELRKLRRE